MSHPEPPEAPPGWRPRGRIMLVIRLLNGRAGGAERLFCDAANMFADAGYDVTVLYCDPRKAPPVYRLSPRVTRHNLWAKSSRKAPWYQALDTLASVYPSMPLFAPVDWLAKNLYFVRRLHAVTRDVQPDVIISFLPPANTPSLLAGWMAGVDVVPTNHSVPEHDYRSPLRWDQNPIDKLLRWWLLRAAEKVHVQFPGFAEWFPEHIRDKAVVIPNFLSPDFLVPEAPRARRNEIVAAGRLADLKNYATLVEAWSLLADKYPDWSVRIWGAGPMRRDLDKQIHQLRLTGSVHLMGHTEAIKDVYLEGQIFCHPAQFEGFGLSVAEALACGLPVVAFADCAGVNEFVKDGENGVMVDRAGGARALADGLERLIIDRGLREALRRRAPGSIKQFSLEAFRDRWVEIIDQIVADKSKR